MSKKDYILLAKVIKNSLEKADDLGGKEIIKEFAINLANSLEGDNSRFSKEKFLRACGI